MSCHDGPVNAVPERRRIMPQRLLVGDEVRVVAPASSLAMIGEESRRIANECFAHMGLVLFFGQHVEECKGLPRVWFSPNM